MPARAQERSLYVARVSGEWVAVAGGDSVPLAALSRVSSQALVRYVGADPRARGGLLVVRDPRTLGKATLRCGPATHCESPADVARLRFETSSGADARTTAIATRLGEQESLRERIRLVGARGGERDLGLVMLVSGDADLSGLAAQLAAPASLVARFCTLEQGTADDDCLLSRRPLTEDCPLSSVRCALRPGAYRVDVFARERSMLGTLAVAAGVAVVVEPARRDAVEARRRALWGALSAMRSEFGDDEWRGLLGSAAIGLLQQP